VVFFNSTLNFSTHSIRTPLEINISLTILRDLYAGEAIVVKMPRFTRRLMDEHGSGYNLDFGKVLISPSIRFIASWTEGTLQYGPYNSTNLNATPFAESRLTIVTSTGEMLPAGSVKITVFKENGISSWCGFPSSYEYNRSAVGYRTWYELRIAYALSLFAIAP
jgi:hypothetical protein